MGTRDWMARSGIVEREHAITSSTLLDEDGPGGLRGKAEIFFWATGHCLLIRGEVAVGEHRSRIVASQSPFPVLDGFLVHLARTTGI